jgi:hypothetical protein
LTPCHCELPSGKGTSFYRSFLPLQHTTHVFRVTRLLGPLSAGSFLEAQVQSTPKPSPELLKRKRCAPALDPVDPQTCCLSLPEPALLCCSGHPPASQDAVLACTPCMCSNLWMPRNIKPRRSQVWSTTSQRLMAQARASLLLFAAALLLASAGRCLTTYVLASWFCQLLQLPAVHSSFAAPTRLCLYAACTLSRAACTLWFCMSLVLLGLSCGTCVPVEYTTHWQARMPGVC